MSLDLPSRDNILERSRADIKAALPESDPYEPTSVINTLEVAKSNRLGEMYDQLRLVSRDNFVSTAEGDALITKASDNGITRNAADQSTGSSIFTGLVGSIIPIGTELQASDGLEYETTAAATLAAQSISISGIVRAGSLVTVTTAAVHGLGSGMTITIAGADQTDYNGDFSIAVISTTEFTYTVSATPTTPATGTMTAEFDGGFAEIESVDVGSDTNKEGGSELTLSNTISGVDATVYTDFDGITGADDEESDEDIRERTLFKIQNPSTPFNEAQIINTTKEISGVTRVWVYEADELPVTATPTSITRTGNIATITFPAVHNLVDGSLVTISGAVETDYNGDFRVIVESTTIVHYVVANTPTTPATGTLSAAYPIVQPGQVRVFFVKDNADSIIPSGDDLTEVLDALLLIKPAQAVDDDVIVSAPTESAQSFVFSALSPNTTVIQTAITANLQELFDGIGLGETITELAFQCAIQTAFDADSGTSVSSFTLSSPSADIDSDFNEILTLDSITFP